jgi:hypothetical protein
MEMIRNNRIEIGYINEYRKNTNLFYQHEASLGLMELLLENGMSRVLLLANRKTVK